VGEVAAGLISRARAGDGDAFRELTEPHRRELHVHCYRMLGSFQDAEDSVLPSFGLRRSLPNRQPASRNRWGRNAARFHPAHR
jgi:hypothetical protein